MVYFKDCVRSELSTCLWTCKIVSACEHVKEHLSTLVSACGTHSLNTRERLWTCETHPLNAREHSWINTRERLWTCETHPLNARERLWINTRERLWTCETHPLNARERLWICETHPLNVRERLWINVRERLWTCETHPLNARERLWICETHPLNVRERLWICETHPLNVRERLWIVTLLRGVGQNDPPLSTVTSACDCWEPPPPPSSVFAVTDHYAVATWETCLVTIGFSTVTSASGCWEGWVKLTHPSQQPQLRLVSPWSGRVHNAHQCQPCLSFERLTSTLFEMRNSVSIKIGKKQSINQSINQIWIKPSISRFLKFAVYCRGLLDPKVSNQSCGGMQAAQCNVLKNATQSHAMTLTFYLALISGSRFRGPLPYLLSWWRIMATRRGRKRNRPQAEGWRPQWSIERLQSRSNATLPPIASWMRQFASFFCLLWLRCTIEIDDGSRKWKERSKYELED